MSVEFKADMIFSLPQAEGREHPIVSQMREASTRLANELPSVDAKMAALEKNYERNSRAFYRRVVITSPSPTATQPYSRAYRQALLNHAPRVGALKLDSGKALAEVKLAERKRPVDDCDMSFTLSEVENSPDMAFSLKEAEASIAEPAAGLSLRTYLGIGPSFHFQNFKRR